MNNNASTDQPNSTSNFLIIGLARGLAGAAIGGLIGYYIYQWALSQGFYALALPGGLLGFGFNLAARRSHWMYGVVCAGLAFALSLFSQWSTFSWPADDGLIYFLTHLHRLGPITWIMIVLGTAVAFFCGRGRV